LIIASCHSDGTTKDNYETTISPPNSIEQEAPDDVLPAPGAGPQYRANIIQQGGENPWPPIPTTDVMLGSGSDQVHVTYRAYMETAPRETRNNIIKVTIPYNNKVIDLNFGIYTDNVPAGISLVNGMSWCGPNRAASVLVIKSSQDIPPGLYVFNIGLEINGKDYGTIPCTIKVLE